MVSVQEQDKFDMVAGGQVNIRCHPGRSSKSSKLSTVRNVPTRVVRRRLVGLKGAPVSARAGAFLGLVAASFVGATSSAMLVSMLGLYRTRRLVVSTAVSRSGEAAGGSVAKSRGCCRGPSKGGSRDIVYKHLSSEQKGSKKKGLRQVWKLDFKTT